MIIKELTELDNFISKTLKDHMEKLDRMKKEEAESRASAEETKEELFKAKEEENIQAINDTMRRYSEENGIADMYAEKISKEEEKILIGKTEYVSYVETVKEAVDSYIHERALIASDFHRKAAVEAENMCTAIKQANEILERLQCDLFKNSDRTMLKNSEYDSLSKKCIKFDDYSGLIKYASMGKNNDVYYYLTGEHREEEHRLSCS